MRGRLATVAVSAVCALAGAGIALWVTQEEPMRIELKVESKRLVAGETFDVEVVPPADERVCFDGAYRLSIRRDDRWVPTNDLSTGYGDDGPYVGRPEEGPADMFSGCQSQRTKHRLRVPSDAQPGRYRLKKWFDLDNKAARELVDGGYEVNPDCCLEVQWWVDFDVVLAPG